MRVRRAWALGLAPSLPLHVNSTTSGLPVTSGTTQTNGVFRLSSSATSGIIDFGMNGSNPWIQATDYTGLNNNYNLLLNPNGGNVGIGTSSLAGLKLVALGATGYPATSGTTQTGVLRLTGGTGLYNVLDMGVNESTDTAWIQATRANSLGTYDSLVINPYGGNVGIGTSSPASKAKHVRTLLLASCRWCNYATQQLVLRQVYRSADLSGAYEFSYL
jgi:hypothetical protein